ncbi:hypothetical protein CPB84DRAFT_1792227 [Gymnopilus junonius]|uniref:Uncharacterized protein n=1 Tax=Gymnopilus junonius TaxID=109634 RepID=A0A9P5TIN9_GYMJU|nr:hypothetical protein CPB84DRAFT_1792227 [Gymnopilus junonius]
MIPIRTPNPGHCMDFWIKKLQTLVRVQIVTCDSLGHPSDTFVRSSAFIGRLGTLICLRLFIWSSATQFIFLFWTTLLGVIILSASSDLVVGMRPVC